MNPTPTIRRLRRPALILALFAAAAALAGCSAEPPDDHPGQPVAKRRAIFKQFAKTLEPMGLVAREREPYKREKFLANAEELARLAREPWGYFTPDANYPPSRAKPEVWSQAADFQRAQDQYVAATQTLLTAAKGDDLDAIRRAVNAVQDQCTSCHKQFRTK
ncbi:cytochrome c [Tibeticola sp.]|uniref:c-type cytochrome n=1 Tax=Tibeticola sp. TaxID=2005368 RepID=UPI0025E90D8A|nr:cytochrome c [Tibeticola sp.]